MPDYTLTYSERDKGWTSFHSFIPDAMVFMDNNYYTFKNGQLYKHYSNATRNNYYGIQYDTTITSILNDSPLQAKMFKTVQLNSNKPWDTEITTDMTTGAIASSAYLLKEGDYYAYIKRVAGNTDLSLMSAQGIGNVTTVTNNTIVGTPTAYSSFKLIDSSATFITSGVEPGSGVYVLWTGFTNNNGAVVLSVDSETELTLSCDINYSVTATTTYVVRTIKLQFSFKLDSIISVGDTVFYGSTPTKSGTISRIDRDNNIIYVYAVGGTLNNCVVTTGAPMPQPSNGDFVLYLKNAQSESYGSRGYYAELKLTYTGTDSVELFAIDSEIFKSFP
tara:strand:- start:583 stop:1581 length:999 start_codon:yes stop_codon:yes gene_type:complete